MLAGTAGNHSSDEAARSGGVIALACMVGATGLATARVTALSTAGVATLTATGVVGLPGQAGANDPAAGMLDQLVQANGATHPFGPSWMSSLN